jgi:large subunit ribosomal protein L9
MQVILLERVHKLGHMGETVNVKPGFARNYLLPQKKALRATESNIAFFEAQKAKLMADNATRKADAEKVAKKIDGQKVTILRQAGETGHLYGSVSARDIADAVVTGSDFKVTRDMVAMHQPIKTLGIFEEVLRVHPEVEVKVKVNVARNEEEAKVQWEKGAAVIASTALAEEAAQSEAAKAALAAELAAAEAAEGKVGFKEAKLAAKKSRKKKDDSAEADEAEEA